MCIGDESGWRPLDPSRVAKTVAKYKNGEFGQTQIAYPTVLAGNKVSTNTGEYLLDNGKNCIAALKELQKEHPDLADMEEEDWPEYMDQFLFNILTDGWELDEVAYDDEDNNIRIAVQVVKGPGVVHRCASRQVRSGL